jgi:VWFA-related protein
VRFLSSFTLVPIFLGFCLSAPAQQVTEVRVGVALPDSAINTVPLTQVQDRLIKALTQKPGKKLPIAVNAIALKESRVDKVTTEAKENGCQFVLSTHLELQTSSTMAPDPMAGLAPAPVFQAVVSYQLNRAVDGAVFALGSAKQQDLTSMRDALSQAISQVAAKAVAEIRKGGNGVQGEILSANNQANELAPPPTEVNVASEDFCDWLPAGVPHAKALHGVCEYAITVADKMPNFICDQAASRYRGNERVPFDLITSSVRYENGYDSYSDVKVNGTPAPKEIAQAPGLWSTGEFGSNNLRSIFNPRNQASFEFTGESKIGEHAAFVFTYKIARQNDPLWRLRAEGLMLAPPYRGEVWIDQKTGDVLRFASTTNNLPKDFPMSGAEQRIDYEKVAFEDGSSFLLPSDFTVSSTYRGEESTRNVVRLSNYHKFRAQARLIFGVPASASGEDIVAGANAATIAKEVEENNEIYEILRAQTLRDDAAALENERKLDLDAATVGALWKLAAIEKEQRKALAKSETARNELPPANSGDGVTTFKASVRLVPVSVVLRDSKGSVVGDVPKEDFHLFDERKPQVITSFSMEQARATGARNGPGQGITPNQSALVPKSGAIPAGEQYVAYVFDDVHSALEDWTSAKDAAIRHLAELRAGDRAAVFSISGSVHLDFTNDREMLLSTLRSMKARPIPPASDCPPVSYYAADLMINKNDSGALAQAVNDTVACAKVPATIAQRMVTGKAFEMLNLGNQESRQMLGVLRDVIRRTAAMPGRKSVVLVSPGFLTPESDMLESMTNLIDQAIRSEIVINALDLRGLYTVGADAGSMTPHAGSTGQTAQSDALAELAGGTGGTFFRNSNDLNEGFRRVANPPEYIYVLGFSPQKLDGKFHRLKVTMTTAEKLKVQAREGYYAPKTAAN